MTETEREIYARIVEAEREWVRSHPVPPPPPTEPPTIHFSELPESPPEQRGAAEWNFYRRVIGRLLAEGHEGRWVLIKGEEIIGIWDTQEEVNRERLSRFLLQDVLMKQICTRERVLRGGGYHRQWR